MDKIHSRKSSLYQKVNGDSDEILSEAQHISRFFQTFNIEKELILAAGKGDFEAVKKLVDMGADLMG